MDEQIKAPETAPERPVTETPESISETVDLGRAETASDKKPDQKELGVTEIKKELGKTAPAKAPQKSDDDVGTSAVPQTLSDKELKDIKSLDPEEQVKVITKIVYDRGLYAAIDAAKKLNDPYIEDKLHDVLVDELYEKLKKGK